MFGRRRRSPFLTAAVVAGTATVASRHGARKQSEMEAQRQFQMEQEYEFRKNQEERDRVRNQQAIDQAVNDALAKQQASQGAHQGSPAPVLVQPAPGPPPMYMAGEEYASPGPGPGPYLQPGSVPARPRSTSAVDSGGCFCSGCGNKCGSQDRFCSRCGRSLARASHDGPEKQAM
ncbi:hypothetical protein NOR_07941 [Metarhizium rileyi]|uniref:Uncharacterized protein n=1 Tax=Metarhizium rileyi (strain RCEF 4871) TaxID=1649241 RepID=A0A166X926_METRR|nr:hypothetical protein NOR_07941 [Metarhizium rileyi RCEF 4871]